MAKRTKLSTLEKKLDKIFSEYIRLEQADDKGMCICVSCGRMFHWKNIDAGHFYSRRNKSVRWDEMNVWPECRHDNFFNIDHLHGYFSFMLNHYGEEEMQKLTDRKNQSVKFSKFDLSVMILNYSDLVKQLKKEKGL